MLSVTESGEIVMAILPATRFITQPAQGVAETATLAADTVALPTEAITEATTLPAVAATMSPPPPTRRAFLAPRLPCSPVLSAGCAASAIIPNGDSGRAMISITRSACER